MSSRSCCIVVMGPYRSGTSLASQILEGLGVYFGPWSEFRPPANRHNPGGYYQRADVIRANTRLVESAGGTIERPRCPAETCAHADRSVLDEVELSWSAAREIWGIKDPRFCVTLQTWLEAGTLDGSFVRIVRVRRKEGAIAESVLKHYEVSRFCEGDYDRAIEMTKLYDGFASWHARSLELPVYELCYDRLVRNRTEVVGELAEFLAVDGSIAVDRCLRAVGKRRALVKYYLHKIRRPALVWKTIRKTLQALRGRA